MIGDDEYLERIVAGVHAATSKDADVRWNEIINGRQFDVVVRFTLGTLRYLVLIEVKNKTRRASASDLEAFVTKARDNTANKAVFVTAAGFQSGAVEVAKRHGVELFTVSFDQSEVQLSGADGYFSIGKGGPVEVGSIELSVGERELGLVVEAITLVYTDGRRVDLPDEQSQMTYYARKTVFKDGTSIEDLVIDDLPELGEVGSSVRRSISLPRPQRIEPPDEHFFPAGKLKAVDFEATTRLGRTVRGNVKIDVGTFVSPVVYTNIMSGEVLRFALHELPLGAAPPAAGGFYCLLHPLRYYYCAKIEGDLITWQLIESFQNGQKITGTYTQKLEYGRHYVPISDRKTLRRLTSRLAEYQARSASAATLRLTS